MTFRQRMVYTGFLMAFVVVLLAFFYIRPGVWRYTYHRNGMMRNDRLTGRQQKWDYQQGRWMPNSRLSILQDVDQQRESGLDRLLREARSK